MIKKGYFRQVGHGGLCGVTCEQETHMGRRGSPTKVQGASLVRGHGAEQV